MTTLIDEAETLLRDRGFKVTPQRTVILQVMASQTNYLDADEVYDMAHGIDASISLATVYRALSLFAELGLIEHRYVEPEHRREVFRLTEGPEQHYLTCVRCGKRVLIHTDMLNQMTHELVRRKGVSVTSACACFTGYCAECTAELQEAGQISST
jgi:Fur family ferric uptake transcriptional regulator